MGTCKQPVNNFEQLRCDSGKPTNGTWQLDLLPDAESDSIRSLSADGSFAAALRARFRPDARLVDQFVTVGKRFVLVFQRPVTSPFQHSRFSSKNGGEDGLNYRAHRTT
jgi:hypothetical protein